MGTKTKDGNATITVIYYSDKLQQIILLFKRDDGIYVTVDFEKNRTLWLDIRLQEFLIEKNYQIIGAFYEN